jgi:uncharacterized protein
MLKSLITRALVPAVALLALPGCATTDAGSTSRAAAAQPGPALWKVADKDTTIYLFGTVHVLPETTEWYDARIASALESSGSIVTELPASAMSDPEAQKTMMSYAMLPADKSLRAMLTDEQRTKYEAALAKMEVPAAAFDRFEPWMAGMTLSLLPLIKSGWTADKGVEKVLEGKAGPGVERGAVETVEQQMKLFDELPQDAQVAFLMSAIDNMDKVVPTLGAMVDAWKVGDADRLAKIMNDSLDDDPALADRLLYARNRTWAQWIDDRLDRPGTVFMAVGAGHLAGAQSVQDALKARGIKSKRVR